MLWPMPYPEDSLFGVYQADVYVLYVIMCANPLGSLLWGEVLRRWVGSSLLSYSVQCKHQVGIGSYFV